MATSRFLRSVTTGCAAVGLVASVVLMATSAASAATVIDGPVDLGTASTYGVLGASAVTNTGPSVVTGDLGVSPGTSITGFGAAPNGVVDGTVHRTDAAAAQAQRDTTTAYDVAASLTPNRSGLTQLNGLSLTPGVYSGGALSLADTGALTLAGSADSVWVFQAASTLTIGSGTRITITGGASSCNVFWQVGSSATIGTGAQFQGTVLAQQSVTATTGATVAGRLLARTGAVTLDTNRITAPTGCPTPGTTAETPAPTITSGAPTTATAGQPYSYTVTATGTPTPTFTASGLPAGLTLDGTTGVVSGTPTTPGSSTVTITASNGVAPSTTTTVTITVRPAAPTATPTPTASATPTAPAAVPSATGTLTAVAVSGGGSGSGAGELAYTGSDPTVPLGIAGLLVAAGTALAVLARRRDVGRRTAAHRGR
ncbi:ice-binding family protein [Curtobacterium sp. L1-20]|uniref:ice-binding family protein n=1 Tax=Curtobacterium sp. L1-20 TaxID=3138181 RepID=UPI003B524386